MATTDPNLKRIQDLTGGQAITGRPAMPHSGVAERVQGLVSQQSPLMQQAAARGAQAANRRGLLNTSMGAQAGQAAQLDVALPIASQDAQQAHQERTLGTEIASRERMLDTELGSRERMLGRELTSRESIAAQDRAAQERISNREISAREQIATLDRQAQQRIAEMNVAAHEREKAASLAAAFEHSYAQVIATIMNQQNLPADIRQQYLNHAARMRDSNLSLVEQMYGVRLNWSTPGA